MEKPLLVVVEVAAAVEGALRGESGGRQHAKLRLQILRLVLHPLKNSIE